MKMKMKIIVMRKEDAEEYRKRVEERRGEERRGGIKTSALMV